MRTAIVSDIHGNFAGLMAVIADIQRHNCDRILCLGDLADGGQQSADVVQYLRDHNILTVQGNHDETPSSDLSLADLAWLQNLPQSIRGKSSTTLETAT